MQGIPFDWKDALRLEDLLTPEEVMIRDSARAYAHALRDESRQALLRGGLSSAAGLAILADKVVDRES